MKTCNLLINSILSINTQHGIDGFEVKLGAVFEAVIEECGILFTAPSIETTLKTSSTIINDRNVDVIMLKQPDIPISRRKHEVGEQRNE